MEPRMETRGSFQVLGVEDDAYKLGVDPGFNDLWMNRFMPRHDDVQPYSTDKAYYGVFFGTVGRDLTKGKYLAGMAVQNSTSVPDGWTIREIPAAEYVVFQTTLRDIGNVMDEVLERWLPNSDFDQDISKPRFDLMPPNTTGQDSPVEIWIPIKRKI